jgi:peptidoglycan/xylan/chitin deacetylase (PgdA/CDA1 family)
MQLKGPLSNCTFGSLFEGKVKRRLVLMKKLIPLLLILLALQVWGKGTHKNNDHIITKFKSDASKKIAFTFDACESKKPAYFDTAIVNYIIANKIPVSIFLSGRFAKRNAAMIRKLSKYDFIEFENHSMNHNNHMDRMKDSQVVKEVLDDQKLVAKLTGRKPEYFRFPAGNYDAHALHLVDSLGLKVVHWTYASGDPDKHFTSDILVNEVNTMTKPGNILIFHINGRGWNTGKALPTICKDLKEKGYQFVKLDEVVR